MQQVVVGCPLSHAHYCNAVTFKCRLSAHIQPPWAPSSHQAVPRHATQMASLGGWHRAATIMEKRENITPRVIAALCHLHTQDIIGALGPSLGVKGSCIGRKPRM